MGITKISVDVEDSHLAKYVLTLRRRGRVGPAQHQDQPNANFVADRLAHSGVPVTRGTLFPRGGPADVTIGRRVWISV